MAKMYLMCGLSGAGKTTFAKNFAKEHNLKYLSIDDLYKSYYEADKTIYDNNDISFKVWVRFFELIHAAEMQGEDIIIDTNALTVVKRIQFIDWFPTFEEHNLIYIMINDIELQKQNNRSRARIVPDEELRRMQKELEPPIFVTLGQKIFSTIERRWTNIYVYENVDNTFVKWIEANR